MTAHLARTPSSPSGGSLAARAVVRAVVLAMMAVGLLCWPAHAHTELVGSTPRAGDAVAMSTDRVVLVFSEDLVGSAQVSVRGPDGSDAVVGRGRTRGDTVEARLELQRPGPQRVTYRAVAGDGHLVTGELTFVVRPRVASSPSETSKGSPPAATEPATGAAGGSVGRPAGAVAIETTFEEDGPPPPLWWLGGAAAAAAVALVGHRLLTRRAGGRADS